MTLDHLREIALIQISQAQRTNAMPATTESSMKANRAKLVNMGCDGIAGVADAVETDMIHAETEDDMMAIISHLEILERNTRTMREWLRSTLEGRAI